MGIWTYSFPTLEDDFVPVKPTVQQIRQMFEVVRRYYATLKLQQKTDHMYYHLKNTISTPTGYEMVLPATARTIVNDAADHITGSVPLFTVPRANRSREAEVQVEKINRWMAGCWERLNESKAVPIHRTSTVHALSKGMIAMHVRWLPERLPKKPKGNDKEAQADYEAKRRMVFPFEWTNHDPQYVYPDPATRGQTYVIEHFWKTVGAVHNEHPEWGGWKDDQGDPKDPNDPVEWLYYCDRYWRAYIANNEFVTFSRQVKPGPVAHGYGFVPWVIRSAGLSDDTGNPDEAYQSMIYIVRGLLDEQMRVMSQIQATARDYAHPWIVVPIGAKVDPGSRKINEVPADLIKGVQMMRPDAVAPKALIEWNQQVEEAIEAATYSKVVTGRAPSGQRSGYSVAVLAGMARIKFQPIKTNVESAQAESMRKTLLLIENKIRAKVPIYLDADSDIEIGPNDVRGYERIGCDLDAPLVQDIAADADIGQKAQQAGVSRETVLKRFFHIENPLEELERRMGEELLEQPAVKAMMTVKLAQAQGIDPFLIQAFMEATGMVQPGANQQPGQTSPGGTPAAPSTGMQGTHVGGAAPPMPDLNNPSVPKSGPTSPMGPQGSALPAVAAIPGLLGRANTLQQTAEIPVG